MRLIFIDEQSFSHDHGFDDLRELSVDRQQGNEFVANLENNARLDLQEPPKANITHPIDEQIHQGGPVPGKWRFLVVISMFAGDVLEL